MSGTTLALAIEFPDLGGSLSWNGLESLVVAMSREVPGRALALALDEAQERLIAAACGPRWAPARGLPASFTLPGLRGRRRFRAQGETDPAA